MNGKHEQNRYYAIVNIILMVENVTQIKSGIIKYAGVSAKIQRKIMHTKRIISGILLHEVLKMVNIYEVLLMIHCLPVMKL